jgi:hypothetical protein
MLHLDDDKMTGPEKRSALLPLAIILGLLGVATLLGAIFQENIIALFPH